MRALRPNALPLARQHESRYRTACHGHVSLYVTANKPAGGKNIKTQYIAIKHFPGVRVVGLILFVFYLFCFTFIYCATLVARKMTPGHENPATSSPGQDFFFCQHLSRDY